MLVGGAVATVSLAGLGTLGMASAATSSGTDPQSSIIDKLTSKFNLNKDEVRKVFDENRTAREAEREAEVKTRLDQLVKDGSITQEQKDKLIAKAKELKAAREANREAIKDKTEAERKEAMKTERSSLKQWLSDNGLTEEYGRYLHGGGRGHGPGGPGGPRGILSESSDSNTN